MAHIVDAEIEGLAGRTKPLKLKFHRHVNMIYGLNGSGKTSLLKILHSAMTGDASSIQNVPFNSARVRVHSLMDKKIYTRTVQRTEKPLHTKLVLKDDTLFETTVALERYPTEVYVHREHLAAVWTETPKRSDKENLVKWQHRYLPTTRLHLGGSDNERYLSDRRQSRLTEDKLDEYFASAVLELWRSYNTEVLASVRSAQETGLANILKAVLAGTAQKAKHHSDITLERAYESTRSFLERQGSPRALGRLEDFSQRYKSNESLQRVVDDIFKVEQEIEEAMAPRKELERLIESLYSGNKKIEFTDKAIRVQTADGGEIGLTSLSSGEKHLIRLLLESLLADKNSILIDEPEISLHVDWQRDLMKICRTLNPMGQFIVATHSPEVLAEIEDNRIIAL